MIGLKINKKASGESLQNRGFEAGDGNPVFFLLHETSLVAHDKTLSYSQNVIPTLINNHYFLAIFYVLYIAGLSFLLYSKMPLNDFSLQDARAHEQQRNLQWLEEP